MKYDKKNKLNDNVINELYEAILLLKNVEEVERFFKDLCTPQELIALAERWRVCQLLATREFSYREISQQTGVSLATITRVARFLKDEPHHGYQAVLKNIKALRSSSSK